MRRFACLLVLALCGRTALADGVYFSESFGGADIKNDLAAYTSNAFRIRAALGYRARHFAFEAWFAGDLENEGTTSDAYGASPSGYATNTPRTTGGSGGNYYGGYDSCCSSTDVASYGLDVKYLQPVAPHLELYMRGGLGRGFVDSLDASGRGLDIGAGIQLKGKVPVIGFLFWPLFFTGAGPKITAAVFADTGYDYFRFQAPGRTIDAGISSFTLGFAVGSDF
jgi:hypothetical protein